MLPAQNQMLVVLNPNSLSLFMFPQELEQKSQLSTEDEQSPEILPYLPPSQPLVRFSLTWLLTRVS